jgi:hypothetical protein
MENNIKCPNCGHQFPVEGALLNQAEEQIRKEYEKKIAQQAAIFNRQKEVLDKEKEEFEKKKEKENELFKERLESRLNEERQRLKKLSEEEMDQKTRLLNEEKERLRKTTMEEYEQKLKQFEEEKLRLRKGAADEFESKIRLLEEENEKRKLENKELKEKELTILKKEAELKERQEELLLEMEKSLLEKREEIVAEVRKKEQEKVDLRIREYEKKLEDQKKLVEEMQRKAEQGSMQMQGEVQELALEDLLRAEFPFDLIDEVGKGVKGADIIQTVINPLQQVCGKIIYESKRTKTFSEQWIEKLKDDQREQGALLAVIVTEVLPKDMERFGRRDGVWVCTYHDVKNLLHVLREMILREHSIRSSQENKGDKMELLYHYLVSDDFRLRVETIVEGFSTLKVEMDREKRAMQKIWKEREKQIEKVITNTIDMYGSIRGIAGNAIAPVKALELGSGEEDALE